MDEAFHWEMDCFVELLRDRVAGNMVRTLFLNRQRAAKVAPSQLKPAETRVSVVGEGAAAVQKMLEKGKASVVAAADLGANDIALLMPGTDPALACKGVKVAWLQAGGSREAVGAQVGVWLSDASEQGRTLEVHGSASAPLATDAGIVVGRWLKANIFVDTGATALLPRLQQVRGLCRERSLAETDELLALSLAAAAVWSEGGIADTELADVAAVVGALFPSYTGGPFNYLKQEGSGTIRDRAAARPEIFAVPQGIEALYAKLGTD